MSTPAIIWIALVVLKLIIASALDGEPQKGTHKFSVYFIGTLLTAALLFWGGFFTLK